jgi:hypothetical protein
MIYGFNDLLNEVASKIFDFQVGSKVVFKGPGMSYYNEPKYGQQVNLLDKTGTVKEITKEKSQRSYGKSTFITFTLDEPIKYKIDLFTRNGFKVDIQIDYELTEIKVENYYFKDFIVLTPEYEELQRKIKAGEVYKFKATRDFNLVLKDIKFKKIGEYFDSSFFDVVSGKTDMVSFIPSKKINTEKGKKPEKPIDPEKFRQETRVGRILRKLNPKLNDQEIEEYVANFRAYVETLFTVPDIQVVTGKDISYWYHEKHYQKGGGSLNNSCMRGEFAQTQVKFYDKFPDKVALAVYIKNDRLWGRALIWRLDDGRVYMDRIYSVKAEASVQLENYAKKFNMITRRDTQQGKGKMVVTLKTKDNAYRPYFDTFIHVYRKDGDLVLSNQAIPGLQLSN